MSSPTLRRPLRRSLAVLISLGALPALASTVVLNGSASAQAPQVSSVGVSGSPTRIVTSKGTELKLSLESYKSSSDPKGTLYIRFEKRTGTESHSWTFDIPKSALAIGSTGKGSLRATLGHFGSVNLAVKPVGQMKQTSCQKQVISAHRTVSISGHVGFDTKSSWGRFQKKGFSFAAPSIVNWSYKTSVEPGSCQPDYTMPCSYNVSWGAYAGNTSIYGENQNGKGSVSAYRYVTLSKTAGISRYDAVSATAPAAKLTNNGAKGAMIKVYGAKGTGTITSAQPSSPYTNTCGAKHTTYTVNSWNGKFKNGASALKMPMQAYGTIALADKSGGYFSKTSPGGVAPERRAPVAMRQLQREQRLMAH